jgi:hypothetical protein
MKHGNTRWAWAALQCVNQVRYKGSGYKGGTKHMNMSRSNIPVRNCVAHVAAGYTSLCK